MKMFFYQKESDRQFWNGIIKDWALLFLLNSVNAGNRAEKYAMDEFFKILKQALG